MTAVSNYASSGHFTSAVGWMMLAVVLCQNLRLTDAAVALLGFVIAELLSRIMVMGLEPSQKITVTSPEWDEALGYVLLRWVLFTIGLLVVSQYHADWFFGYHQYALICILGLCLILALIRLVCTFTAVMKNHTPRLAKVRNAILAVSIYCVAQLGALNSDMVLSLAVALLLGILFAVSLGIRRPSQELRNGTIVSARSQPTNVPIASLIWRYADLIILALILSPQNTLIYLIARGLAQVVPLALDILTDRIVGPLRVAHCAGNLRHFAAIAARTNLGFLLIGGSASLIALSLSAYVPLILNLDTAEFRYILFWLVIIQAASALFGATGILFNITQCKSGTIFLPLLGIVLFWATIFLTGTDNPLKLAQVFASTHLLIGAASALLIGLRFGIWPGITAILFRQIKIL